MRLFILFLAHVRRFLDFVLSVSVAHACQHPPPAPVPAQQTGHLSQAVALKAESDLRAASSSPAPPLPPVAPQVLAHGRRDLPLVALTFDACSTRDVSQYDQRVTRELIAAKVPATIFLGGSWAREEADHVREIASVPVFELGNHSYTHPHMTAIKSEERIRLEIERTQAQIYDLTGVQPKLFRPPYGEYDQRVVRIAAELGLTTVEYDVASGDPDAHATKERLIEWVLRKARPGSIIVMHINHRRFHTSEALPDIISGLRAKGFELVTVGRLLADTHGLGTSVVLREP
jgi:peptidoglycan-N-acetylglucosamine deacetylase